MNICFIPVTSKYNKLIIFLDLFDFFPKTSHNLIKMIALLRNSSRAFRYDLASKNEGEKYLTKHLRYAARTDRQQRQKAPKIITQSRAVE